MKKKPAKKRSWKIFILFLIGNFALYLFLFFGHDLLPFNSVNYVYSAHHYVEDPRFVNGQYNFLRALGQYDAQWYLRIADKGYPPHPTVTQMNSKPIMDGLSYAFFPLYPLLLGGLNKLIHNIELTAFITANVLLLANFFSFQWIMQKRFPQPTIDKATLLLFFSPMSIFYRSYFTEGLYLLLLLWFSYFLLTRKFTKSALMLGLLTITKANGWLLIVFFLSYLLYLWHQKRIGSKALLQAGVMLGIPLLCFISFTYAKTGNPFYFFSIRSAWGTYGSILGPLQHNISLMLLFPILPIHAFHLSQLDILSILIIGALLFYARKSLPTLLWWIAFCLWLSPLLVTDTMSYSRYQIVSFPIFLYLADVARGWKYTLLLSTSIALCFVFSLLFINWTWLG